MQSQQTPPSSEKATWKRRARRWALDILILFAVYWAIQAYQTRDAARGVAPSLSAISVEGKAIRLQPDRQRPVLVHFWATWCPICRLEHGSIQNLARDYDVITIASQSGGAGDVAGFMREQGLTFVTIPDPRGEWAQAFGVHAFPTSFVLDKTGTIRFVELGYTSEWGLRWRMFWAGL